MVTDDERREVARRLRGNPEDTLIPHRTGRHHGMGCHEAADRFWGMCDRIKEAGNYDIAFSTTSVLADLIEPSCDRDAERTCRNLNPPSCRDFECSECGESSEFTPGFMPNYCPNCGARVTKEASDDADR